MPILDGEGGLECLCNLLCGGDFTVGEDVLVDPGIGDVGSFVVADGVEQKQPIRCHHPRGGSEIGRIILEAHVLEHTDGGHFIEVTGEIPVVHQLDTDRQSGAIGLSEALLLLRDRNADYLHSVALCRKAG